jgi:ferric-dicitrate binding protein FerR (iron transport regulator)
MHRSLLATLLLVAACSEETPPPDETGTPPPADAAAAAGAPAEPATPVLPARRFVSVEGTVTLDTLPAKADLEIGETSTIETGKDGRATITVEPGSLIEVRANSKVTFGASPRAKNSLKLLVGALWSFLPDNSSFEVETQNAVAGVRGTIFFVKVDKKGKKESTYVCACHGNVAMKSADGKSFDQVVESPNTDHKSYTFVTKGKKQKVAKAKRQFHTDDEKMALMPLMEKVK